MLRRCHRLVALELLQELLDVFDFGDAPIAIVTARQMDSPALALVVGEIRGRGVAISMQQYERPQHGDAGS